MSDDLGPFAIKRIERRTTAVSPVTSLAEQAAEAFADRARGDIERGSVEDTDVTQAIALRSGAIDAANLAPIFDALSVSPSSSQATTGPAALPGAPGANPATRSTATGATAPAAPDDPLDPLFKDLTAPQARRPR